MSDGLRDPVTWIEPFGLVKRELDSDGEFYDGGDPLLDLAVLAVALAFDLVTLPLALVRVVGLGSNGSEA